MNLSELFYNIEYESNFDISCVFAERITHNPNKIDEKTLLITFGAPKDVELSDQMPSAIICDTIYRSDPPSLPTVYVSDPRLVYSLLASRLCMIDYGAIDFIGVTGTNGKTTCTTMIYEIMLRAGKNVGLIGTSKIIYKGMSLTDCNYSMTTPDPDLLYPAIKKMQDMGCSLVVMEISSHALTLKKVAPINFKVSAFTSLSAEHMDFHRNMENYYQAKLALFRQSTKGVFNTDDEYSHRAVRDCKSVCEVFTVGILNDAGTMAKDIISYGLEGSSYIYRGKRHIFKIRLRIPGYYNVYNSLMAAKCAIEYGISAHTVRDAIASISGIEGRCEIISCTPCIIIDYAHTEVAFENILKTVKEIISPTQSLITIFGCGGERDKEKRPKMASVAQKYSDKIIITSDNPRNENPIDIINDIIEGISDPAIRDVIPDRRCAIEYAVRRAKDDDVILILGKGHERYVIDKDGYHSFDERMICNKALNERRSK